MDDNEDQEPSEIMAEFLTQFMASGTADILYRKNYCDTIVGKVYNEFGTDGFAELLISMDKKAEWITDILFEPSDLDEIAFKNHGVFDAQIVSKSRSTDAFSEFNEKLWRMRRKYAKLMVAEVLSWDKMNDKEEDDIPPF